MTCFCDRGHLCLSRVVATANVTTAKASNVAEVMSVLVPHPGQEAQLSLCSTDIALHHSSQKGKVNEGYTPAARVRNNSDSKQGGQFYVIVFPTFSHSTPLHWAISPFGTLFSFLSPPPPLVYPCALGLGVGVMGNARLCSHSAHGQVYHRSPRRIPCAAVMRLSQRSITPRMTNKVGVAMEGTKPTPTWDWAPHVV